MAAPHVATSLFLPLFNYKGQQFNFICDLLLNRPAAMWNPFVQWEHITPLTLTCKVNCHKLMIIEANNQRCSEKLEKTQSGLGGP